MAMVAERPLVSVCIANYNGIGLIEACIESVLAQDWEGAVEIIVHDDASGDGSVNFIRSRHPSVKLIESPENVGFCIANNRMAVVAQGEYLLLLNNDAVLLPDALRTLLEEARNLACPAILGLPQYDAQSGRLLDIGSLLDPFLNPVPNLNPERDEVGMVMGACLWIPKKLWEELDGFPAWFGSIGEDLYLCCLARLWGHPVRAVKKSGYRHHVGNSFGGGKVTQEGKLVTTRRRRVLSERNKSFVMIMTFPGTAFQILFPLHMLTLAAEGVFLALFRWDWTLWRDIYWSAVRSIFRQRQQLLEYRRAFLARSRVGLFKFFCVFDWWPYKLRMLWCHGMPEVR